MPDQMIPQEQPADPQAQALGAFPYPDDASAAPGPSQAMLSNEDKMAQLNARFAMTNIAEDLPEDLLARIGQRVLDDYEIDLESRSDWKAEQDKISELASLTTEAKSWGGKPVANIKDPMILVAAIHFASRCYPEIVKGNDVVKCRVVGKDSDGTKAAQAARVGTHMSYQLLEQMDWEEDLDQLLVTLPIAGSIFKKTYRCPVEDVNVSELIMPKDLVVNYWAKDMDKAERVTHPIELTQNEIVERISAGVFRSQLKLVDFGQPIVDTDDSDDHMTATNDEDAPHIFLEQHRWWDLDGDGYQEPYIILVHKATAKTVRICARYDLSGIHVNDAGELIRITAVNYFTHFKFLPAFDGSFYGVGLGKLLFSANSAVNSISNQLLDAGTANNRSSGFIARSVQIGPSNRSDALTLAPGDWKFVPCSADDLRKALVEIPSKEPSRALFELLKFLVDMGKEISGVSDIMAGESPGPNVPAASTLALIEQGMKVFNGIFKRVYKSLGAEFKKIARLNRMYLSEEEYFNILDDSLAISKNDYSQETLDIVPVADPSSISDVGRMMKMQALIAMKGQGLNDQEIDKRYLMSLNIDDPEALLPDPNAGPPAPPPLEQAQIDKLKSEKDMLVAQQVESRVRGQFAALQTAVIIMQQTGVATVANELLLSAGFPDQDKPPIVPENVPVDPLAPPVMPGPNTSPGFPALPKSPNAGENKGIETMRNEGAGPAPGTGAPQQ